MDTRAFHHERLARLDLVPLGVALYVSRVPSAREVEAALGKPVRVVGDASGPDASSGASGTARCDRT